MYVFYIGFYDKVFIKVFIDGFSFGWWFDDNEWFIYIDLIVFYYLVWFKLYDVLKCNFFFIIELDNKKINLFFLKVFYLFDKLMKCCFVVKNVFILKWSVVYCDFKMMKYVIIYKFI